MKIALLADAYLTDESTGVNGTQVQLYQLAHAFAARGHEVHYICQTRRPNSDTQLCDGRVIVHYRRNRSGLLAWISGMLDMGRYLAAIGPEAVYQRGRAPLTYLAAHWSRRSGRPFVWGSNGEDSGEYFKYCGRLRRSSRHWLRKLLLMPDAWLRDLCIHRGIRGATHIVAQTAHQQEQVAANFGKPAAILPSYFHTSEPNAGTARERLVLWLATLSPGKQPGLFLDIAKALSDVPGWRFFLGGGTANREFARSLGERGAGLPALEFAGAVPFNKTGALFARASLYISTSRPEADGLPNAFIQAWLHGTPVLSLHHDPNGWITKHRLGFFAAGDMRAMVNMCRMLLSDPSRIESMRPRCTAFAQTTFADPRVIDTYLQLFTGHASAEPVPCPA